MLRSTWDVGAVGEAESGCEYAGGSNGDRRGPRRQGRGRRLPVACGEIDAASAPVLAAELHQAIAAGDGPILLDLGAVTFMDSSGVTVLLTAHQMASARLRLATVHPAVERVLEITGVLDLFSDAGHRS